MKSRAKDYYYQKFCEELSIAEAISGTFDFSASVFENDIYSHFLLCASLIGVMPSDSIEAYQQRFRAKERLDTLMNLHEQKRLMWLKYEEPLSTYQLNL